MKTALCISIVLLAAGCSTVKPISDSHSVWISKTEVFNDRVYFCSVDKENVARKPIPTCFEAEMFRKGTRYLSKEEIDKVLSN